MRSFLLWLAPRRWREAIEGDLEEATPRGRGRRAWILVHLAAIVIRLRIARAAALMPGRFRPPVIGWIREAIQDVRYGIRRWLARPAFTAGAVATIALGIGTTSALFSIVDGVLLQPLPYPHPERLVSINRTYPEWQKDPILSASWNRISLAWPEFFYVRDRSRTIETLAVITTRIAIVDRDGAREHRVGVVSASFFPMLGISPTLGRTFSGDADLEDPGTVLISHAVWQTQFGADPSVVGKVVPIRGGSRVVAGVLPKGFVWGARHRQYDFWYPLSAIPANERADNNRNLDAIARMRPGISIPEVTDEMTVLLTENFRYKSKTAAVSTAMLERQLLRVRTPLLLLLLAGSILLLVHRARRQTRAGASALSAGGAVAGRGRRRARRTARPSSGKGGLDTAVRDLAARRDDAGRCRAHDRRAGGAGDVHSVGSGQPARSYAALRTD